MESASATVPAAGAGAAGDGSHSHTEGAAANAARPRHPAALRDLRQALSQGHGDSRDGIVDLRGNALGGVLQHGSGGADDSHGCRRGAARLVRRRAGGDLPAGAGPLLPGAERAGYRQLLRRPGQQPGDDHLGAGRTGHDAGHLHRRHRRRLDGPDRNRRSRHWTKLALSCPGADVRLRRAGAGADRGDGPHPGGQSGHSPGTHHDSRGHDPRVFRPLSGACWNGPLQSSSLC